MVLSWDVAGMSHQGKVRSKNEDHFIVARFGRFLETVNTNISLRDVPARAEELGYGLIVADGLGGHVAGEIASRSAITILWDLVLKTPDWIFRLEDEAFVAEVIRRAEERCVEIDMALVEQGLLEPDLEGMATTLTFAATVESTVVITHVGDSRAYLLRQGRLFQLTRDHTHVQELVAQNVLNPQDVPAHRLRHVLTNALGIITKNVEPDVQTLALRDSDCLLLCTDGLSSYVEERTIFTILNEGETAAVTCQRLVDEALRTGGKDNVTVVVGRSRLC